MRAARAGASGARSWHSISRAAQQGPRGSPQEYATLTRTGAPSLRRPDLAQLQSLIHRRFGASLRDESREDAKENSSEPADSPVRVQEQPDPATGGTEDERGAIGGFMRGLIGGREVAAEDSFVAEAKEQGIEVPPPPPPRRADLVPVKRRRRSNEAEGDEEQSIRDRLFSRFAGSAFMQGAFEAKERITARIDESDNPIINMFRNIYDRLFAENEMAMVVREIREEDPTFVVSEFLQDVEREYIPKILGAYLSGDRTKLSDLCTEDALRMLSASIREREAEGILMDTNILDISDVELSAGRLLEDAPVLIVTFSAQQINCLRDKSGAVIEGAVDDIRAVYYVWAFVREYELEEDAPTGGSAADSAQDREGGQTDQDGDDETETLHGDGEKKTKSQESSSAEGGASSRPWKMMEMVIRGAHATI